MEGRESNWFQGTGLSQSQKNVRKKIFSTTLEVNWCTHMYDVPLDNAGVLNGFFDSRQKLQSYLVASLDSKI